MNELKSAITKLSTWSVVFAVFFLPLKTSISNFGLILYLVCSIISIILGGYNKRILKSPRFYLLTSFGFFIFLIIGLLYTPFIKEGIDLLGRLVFYALIPLTLLRGDLDKDKFINPIFYSLLFGCVLSMFYLHVNNIHAFFANGGPFDLRTLFGYNHTSIKFVEPLSDMHPVYLGAYYLMLLSLLFSHKFNMKSIYKFCFLLLIIITVIFLNSRIIILLLLFYLIFKIFRLFKRFKKYVIIGVSFMSVFLFILKDTYVFVKLTNGFVWELTEHVEDHGVDSKKKGDSRMARWLVAFDLIKEKPIFGYGTGSERLILTEKYFKEGMDISQKHRFNSHNQYLGFTLDYGLIGLILLLIFLIGNIVDNIKNKNGTGCFFFIIIAACCLTENFLIRNMGVNFVVIFVLFYNINYAEKI